MSFIRTIPPASDPGFALSAGTSPYRGCTAVLATMHGKQQAIAPALTAVLGLHVAVPKGLDTDSLGTFTGETPRPGTMRETARRKAMMGIEATGLPLAIASEGSFGQHPVIPFLPASHELLLFIDRARGLELAVESWSEDTNFGALEVTSGADVEGFLARVGFPSHGLILRTPEKLFKGIASRRHLDHLLARHRGPLRLETDMRAYLNPTRMKAIARLAEALAQRIAAPCPACSAPGFGPTGAERGLPCVDCGAATPLTQFVIETCSACSHVRRLPRSDGRSTASPAECQECNP